MHCSLRLIVKTLVFSRSYLHRQVSPPETLVVKGGTTWARNGRLILPENARLRLNIQGSFTCRKSTTWDNRLYFPSEGRRAEDFFALKNPKGSAGLVIGLVYKVVNVQFLYSVLLSLLSAECPLCFRGLLPCARFVSRRS